MVFHLPVCVVRWPAQSQARSSKTQNLCRVIRSPLNNALISQRLASIIYTAKGDHANAKVGRRLLGISIALHRERGRELRVWLSREGRFLPNKIHICPALSIAQTDQVNAMIPY